MGTVLQMPFSRGEASQVGPRLFRKQVLRQGSIRYQGRTLNFDRAYLSKLVEHFRQGAFRQVPFVLADADNKHNEAPEKASRPFDKHRDGFIMGEGAGVLVLETLAHARARGARIYCELIGYAATCDAFHITQPDPEGKGLSLAMTRALASASVAPEDIDYINAHGTSTPYNDKFETLAIKKVFGDHARKVAISSTKSMTGHLLGAAGGIESVISVKTIQAQTIAPTINLEEPDPDCDLDYVPNVARSAKVRTVLSNNLGFGGQNAAVVFRAV